MGKINFEEYRQPWETGPHWELKREFIEKYQDDFPEDRLLCLAQAYSNIELLHCSYPDPVMLQIHELSKPLNGCKHFRDVKRNVPGDESEGTPTRKRKANDNLQKSAKFIKFYSVGTSQATDDSATGDVSVTTTKKESFSEDKPASSLTTPSSANVPSSTPALESKDNSPKAKLIILSLPQSPDFKLITQIAEKRKSHDIRARDAVGEIECIVDLLNLQRVVHYKITSISRGYALCELYVKDTLISIGRDNTEKGARLMAASSALEILTNASNLPVTTINDFKTTDGQTLGFLKKFLQELTKANRVNLISTENIKVAASCLKCDSHVTYFSREDHERPMGKRVFYCDVVIKKVLICTGRRTVKKKAKRAATDQVIPVLLQFFKELPEDNKFKVSDESSTQHTVENSVSSASLKTVPAESSSSGRREETVSLSKSGNSNSLPQSKGVNSKQPPVKVPEARKQPPVKVPEASSPFVKRKINYKLLNNSLEKKFAIIDNSEVTPLTQYLTPHKLLNHSAQFCKKIVSYDIFDGDFKTKGLFRCDLVFDGDVIGVGGGSTKAEAKNMAAAAALQNLEKHFYTIKVKSELDGNFIVKRNQMMNINVASDAVSDSNVGCKMLKMMGWTGGGLGKTGGITEPIMASGQMYHQGLGFADYSGDTRKFRQNIESLLREYSRTDTTSDLIFCTDFTKEERKIIHRVAGKFGLNGNSKGSMEKRQLFVKHKQTVTELLNHLVRAGGCTHKYELVDKST